MVSGTSAFTHCASDLSSCFLRVRWWISSDSRFTLNERLLLSLLLDHKVMSAVPRLLTDKYIAERFGWSSATINRTLKSLLAKHLIRISYLRREGLRSTLRMVELNTYQMDKIKAAFEGDNPDRFWRWDYGLVANTDLNTREIAAYGIIRAFAECDQILTRFHLRTLAGISVDSEDRIVRKFKQRGIIDVKYTMSSNRTTRKFTVNPNGFGLLKKAEPRLTLPKTGTEAPVHHNVNQEPNPVSQHHNPSAYILSNTNRLSKPLYDAQTSLRDGAGLTTHSEFDGVEQEETPVKASSTQVVEVISPPDPFTYVQKTKSSPSVSKEKIVEEDVVRGRDLFKTVKQNKCRPTNTKPSTLASGFTALREIDGIEGKDIDAVLVWYRKHFVDKYTPRVYSSEGFREKWNQLWQAYQTSIDEVPPLDQYPEIRLVIESFTKRTVVPSNIQKQFPSFCFKSIRNQTEWKDAVRKHYRDFPEKYRINEHVGTELLMFFRAPPIFMPDYFHEIIHRHAKFSSFTGDVSKQAWTPDCTYEVDRLVQAGVLSEKALDRYRAYVKEVMDHAN